jgi:hypothetical protein
LPKYFTPAFFFFAMAVPHRNDMAARAVESIRSPPFGIYVTTQLNIFWTYGTPLIVNALVTRRAAFLCRLKLCRNAGLVGSRPDNSQTATESPGRSKIAGG